MQICVEELGDKGPTLDEVVRWLSGYKKDTAGAVSFFV